MPSTVESPCTVIWHGAHGRRGGVDSDLQGSTGRQRRASPTQCGEYLQRAAVQACRPRAVRPRMAPRGRGEEGGGMADRRRWRRTWARRPVAAHLLTAARAQGCRSRATGADDAGAPSSAANLPGLLGSRPSPLAGSIPPLSHVPVDVGSPSATVLPRSPCTRAGEGARAVAAARRGGAMRARGACLRRTSATGGSRRRRQ